jgi:hypothetical protein
MARVDLPVMKYPLLRILRIVGEGNRDNPVFYAKTNCILRRISR